MAFINLKSKIIQVKIVYYGPGRGGKTTNLEYIYRKFHQRINSEMVTVKTHGDRTLFFDFCRSTSESSTATRSRSSSTRSRAGQVQRHAPVGAAGVDGIVFVADAMAVRPGKNLQALKISRKTWRATRRTCTPSPG